MSTVDPYRCDDCGLDLSLSEKQLAHAIQTGRIMRSACPRNADGLHRISQEQLDRRRTLEAANSVR